MKQRVRDSFSSLLQFAGQGRTVRTITLVAGPPQADGSLGEMLAISADGQTAGIIVNDDFTRAVLAHAPVRAGDKPDLFGFEYDGDNYRCFYENITPIPKAVIFGGGHISQPLAEMLKMLDFRVVVVDDRPDFANSKRFPRADKVICDSFAKAAGTLSFDANTAVIIVTRGHRCDIECLKLVLPFRTKYLGMIGSRRRVNTILSGLIEDGADQERIKEIRSPIGLDIGAQTPAEIAVSIVAEIIADFRGAESDCSLSRKGGCRHG